MKKPLLTTAVLLSLNTGMAQAEDGNWTEIGVYGFLSDVSGETTVGTTTSDVDVSFSELLENLDVGFMGFAEHRNGKWSFIGDIFYAEIGIEDTLGVAPGISATIDVDINQLMVEGFVGYRVFEQDNGNSDLGVDLLGGVRYNSIDIELGVRAVGAGLVAAASADRNENWYDGVVGARVQYGHDNGWGASGWADYGAGSDSSSYQLAGFVGYRFDNNVRTFGGYRHYYFENDSGSGASRLDFDLDFSGPLLGVSYRL